jgi:hypothetical protein
MIRISVVKQTGEEVVLKVEGWKRGHLWLTITQALRVYGGFRALDS